MSPADLAKACGMFSKLRLPIRRKIFRSGLIVIMDSSATEEFIERQILTFITGSGEGVTALQIGNKFHWSVGVASELLQVYIYPCPTPIQEHDFLSLSFPSPPLLVLLFVVFGFFGRVCIEVDGRWRRRKAYYVGM